jgi:alpha-glucosidase
MKRLFLTLCLFLPLAAFAASEENPVANEKATVVCGNARFTVLTSRLIRMEWAEDGVFEDRATLAIVNRRLPVPAFKASKSGKGVTIKTADLTLKYNGKGKFSGKNLSVSFKLNGKAVKWVPGADASGNLMGTFRTLDGCEGFDRINYTNDPYEPGLLSRDGWAIVDESTRHVLNKDDSDWGEWVAARPEGDRIDWYIFAYGHDYKAALKDFTQVAGRIPLPPKFAFGYWWSRYWQYSDFEFLDLARDIRSHSIPMDVMVIDMDWHDIWTLRRGKDAPKDEFGQRIGWTGYTWQKELFPDPESTLAKLHAMNLKTSLNLHPASGIQPYEDCYEPFVKDYAARAKEMDWNGSGPVPFRIDQKEWADSYFNAVIHPLERQGVDFWWLDWQQWKESKYTPGLSNTFWLNYTFFNDKLRRSRETGLRPMIYHRWGGLGSHRYQIGFSGDTRDTWEVLRFLPYFTATSSNVGYGYWGHDIGGHQYVGDPYKPEEYTRWLQYGVFTPIFKTHCTKSALIERRVWTYPEEYAVPMRDAIRLRYTLSPYIYNAAREAYDTGVCICRPLYYDYPEAPEAYDLNEEFLFGDRILATAVWKPVSAETGMASREIWFPEGDDWYDMATGRIYKGGERLTLNYTLSENPWWVKAGSIIPMASEDIRSLQEPSNLLRLFIAPGEGESSITYYEDDGSSQDYESTYATTLIRKESSATSCKVTVSPRKGSYKGMDYQRRLEFILEGVYAPTKVKVNGSKADWEYVGKDLALVVTLSERPAGREVVLEVEFPGQDTQILRGKKGLMHRMMAYTPVLKDVSNTCIDPYKLLSRPFLKLAQCASRIEADPEGILRYLSEMDVEAVKEDLEKDAAAVEAAHPERAERIRKAIGVIVAQVEI